MVVGCRFGVRAHPSLLILVPCCCLDSRMSILVVGMYCIWLGVLDGWYMIDGMRR